jgi:VWFA-related protein
MGQDPPPMKLRPQPAPGDEVVRVTTNLVQVDAVVTDKNGKPVTDLHAEDFEILEDGRAQPITNFAYVPTESRLAETAQSDKADKRNGPPVPSAPLSRDKVRRTIVLAVDTLGISYQSMQLLKPALRRFVEQQMQPGDQILFFRTGGGTGYLTSNKQQLLYSIDHLQWQCMNRMGLTVFRRPECFSMTIGLSYTLDSLIYLTQGLKALPGRKTMLLFSDSFEVLASPTFGEKNERATISIENQQDKFDEMTEAANRLTGASDGSDTREHILRLVDTANQSSTVIYTVDPRGLVVTSPTAMDSGRDARIVGPSPVNDIRYGNLLDRRSATIWETQTGLQYLAHETGGLAIINNNDIGNGLDRIMSDLTGYYLIGYRPSDATFPKSGERVPYHKLKLRVLRPGLQVRSRKGFYGKTDLEKPKKTAVPKPMELQVVAAVESPFTATDLRLRLTALFANGDKGSVIHLMLYLDARDLTFGTTADGWQQAVINVMASIYGEDGLIADYLTRSETIRARGRTLANIKRNGLMYDLFIPAKKPGAYQVRAAVRDAATERMGSAFQFVAVPDLKKEKLALSGITLSSPGIDLESIAVSPVVENEASIDEVRVHPSPAVRRFQSGMLLEYRYSIYNARLDRKGQIPAFVAQVKVFRDGELVTTLDQPALDTRFIALDVRYLNAKGRLRLPGDFAPGQYVLQIVITDPQGREPAASAFQSVDFEIVK